LSLADSKSRKYLNEQMENFLDNKSTDQPEGFNPS
jgi:Fe-S cluster biosynthesis and repair protein YggX